MLAPQHPERQDQQPFKAVLDTDMKALAATGEKGAAETPSAATGSTTPLSPSLPASPAQVAAAPRRHQAPALAVLSAGRQCPPYRMFTGAAGR